MTDASPPPPGAYPDHPHTDPGELIEALRQYHPESYWPDEYLTGATALLADSGWLLRPINETDRAVIEHVLDELSKTGLDVTDVYPLGLAWALRSTGAVAESPALDATLLEWRRWEEDEHLGEPLTFLPDIEQATVADVRRDPRGAPDA